ncbi:hypothetical protein Hanom_Chr16g01424771 [Helianthus anomalus]
MSHIRQYYLDLQISMTNANEILKKDIEELRADKEIKDEQIKMLYAVIEYRLGINVHAAFDEIEIQRAEARRMEKEKRVAEETVEALKDKGKGVVVDTEEILGSLSQQEQSQPDAETAEIEVNVAENEVNNDLAIVPIPSFILVGKSKEVVYSEEVSLRIIEVEHRRLKGKLKKFEVDDDEELNEWFGEDDDDDHYDDKDDNGNDDDQDGASGALNVKSSRMSQVDDFLNDEQNEERDEDQRQGESTPGTKHADLHEIFSNTPKVIYLNHTEEEGELVEKWTRESILETLDMDDNKFKFDIEEEIPPTPDREYVFKFVNEADNFDDVIIEEGSDSDQDVLFHYTGLDDDFPTFDELFRSHNEDELRRKVFEKIATDGIPKTILEEDLREEKKKWFRAMPEEKKFKRSLKFFTRHQDKSLGDILSWGYLEDLKVYAIKREYGVQYFEFLQDMKTLPWWDVEELVKTKNIKQYYFGLEVKCHEQRLWDYIKQQANLNFPHRKPQQPKVFEEHASKIVKIDQITREKDITLHVRHPRCLKNMPLREMEQDFYKDFKGWIFNPSDWRHIDVLDPMWLVNCSKKDIECLFFNKIVYNEVNKHQAQRCQKLVNVCFAKDINSGRYWESKWRNLELEEFLEQERYNENMKKKMADAAKRERWRLGLEKPVTDQTPIEKAERKIPRWSKARDGDRVYREWWINVGRHLRQRMFEEHKEERRRKEKERRRNRKA